MISEKTYVDNLKSIITQCTDDWLADMIEYAIAQARNGNWSPINAAASTMTRARWGSRFAETMYAIGLFTLVKRETVEKPETWRDITILYRLVPRERAKCPETGAILDNATAVQAAIKALLMGIDREVIKTKLELYRKAQAKTAEEKAAETARRRSTVSYWVEKIERVLRDAEKARIPTGPILDKIIEKYRAPSIPQED